MTRSHLSVLFAAVLVLSLPAAVGPAVADGDNYTATTTTLDEDTALTENATIEQFESEGTAVASPTVPDMTITVAEDAEDVGLTTVRHTSFDTTYLRVEYDESLERTVRFYVPREYWHPHPDRLEAVDGAAEASMEPTEGTDYSAIQIHFEEETDATFAIKKQASFVFNARDYGSEWLEEEAGIEVPTPGSEQEQWEYVPTSELTADDPTFGIDTEGDELTLQYDDSGTADPTDKQWRTVPSCSSSGGSDAPVCKFEQADNPNHIYVLAQTQDPPDIRFKHDAGFWADARSSFGELFGDIPRDLLSDVRGLFDGLFS